MHPNQCFEVGHSLRMEELVERIAEEPRSLGVVGIDPAVQHIVLVVGHIGLEPHRTGLEGADRTTVGQEVHCTVLVGGHIDLEGVGRMAAGEEAYCIALVEGEHCTVLAGGHIGLEEAGRTAVGEERRKAAGHMEVEKSALGEGGLHSRPVDNKTSRLPLRSNN